VSLNRRCNFPLALARRDHVAGVHRGGDRLIKVHEAGFDQIKLHGKPQQKC
jgi:hypothetical protein